MMSTNFYRSEKSASRTAAVPGIMATHPLPDRYATEDFTHQAARPLPIKPARNPDGEKSISKKPAGWIKMINLEEAL